MFGCLPVLGESGGGCLSLSWWLILLLELVCWESPNIFSLLRSDWRVDETSLVLRGTVEEPSETITCHLEYWSKNIIPWSDQSNCTEAELQTASWKYKHLQSESTLQVDSLTLTQFTAGRSAQYSKSNNKLIIYWYFLTQANYRIELIAYLSCLKGVLFCGWSDRLYHAAD